MRVLVNNIQGLCGRCGGEEFDEPARPLKAVTRLVCKRCGTSVAYGSVLTQIGREAVYQSRHNLRMAKEAFDARQSGLRISPPPGDD